MSERDPEKDARDIGLIPTAEHRPNDCCDYHRHIADGCCHCENEPACDSPSCVCKDADAVIERDKEENGFDEDDIRQVRATLGDTFQECSIPDCPCHRLTDEDRATVLNSPNDIPVQVRNTILQYLDPSSKPLPEPELLDTSALTTEQQARSEAIRDARFALETRREGGPFGSGKGSSASPPSAADIIRVAKFIITGTQV